MRFFFDNCISPQLPEVLRVLGAEDAHQLKHLQELYDPSTPDVGWIPDLGAQRDWIIISGDENISTAAAEKAAWHDSGLTAFFFCPPFQKSNRWVQARTLLDWWPRIVMQARSTPVRHGFRMPLLGSEFKQCYPPLAPRRRR